MNVLYFLEPRKELGNPLFRLGSVRNHLVHEIKDLSLVDDVDVRLLASEEVAKASLQEGLLSKDLFLTVPQSTLDRNFKRNDKMGGLWYSKEYTDREMQKAKRIYSKVLKGFVPDVIVCYESSCPYLKSLFPDSLILNSMLGMLSRAPYPEMGAYDPVGLYGKSFLAENIDKLKSLRMTKEQSIRLESFRSCYREFINDKNPIDRKSVRSGFEKCVLLPMQVSGYFAYDECLPKGWDVTNQIDLIKHVMPLIDENIGVYVTLHGAESDIETRESIEKLQAIYSNLLFDQDVQRVRWCSQWVLPHMDGVVSVSSSVGYQAALWNKPVFVVGDSQLNVFDSGKLSEIPIILNQNDTNYDAIIYYILTRYSPLIDGYCHNGEWLYSFFKRMKDQVNDGVEGLDIFTKIDNEDDYFKALKSSLRHSKTAEELERYSSHLSSTRIVDVDKIKSKIEGSEIISFDVFDTLITRRLMHPNHVFELMNSDARRIFEHEGLSLDDFGGFRNLRERAANRIIRSVKRAGGEEIHYKAIYEEIRRLTKLTKESTLKIRKLELKVEKDVMTHRPLGVELFRFAKSLGKTVILVSDMYLEKDDIAFILKKNGIDGYADFFVSSDYGVTKKNGGLFDIVLNRYKRKDILHLGDNHLADVLRPLEKGIKAEHLPIINETYHSSSLAKENYPESAVKQSLGESLMHGVISRSFYDNRVFSDNWFDQSPYRLGFEACGSILFGFTKWILEQSIRDGVEDLYFLARDGFLVKEIYDKISKSYPNAPRSHYLLASRRCFSTAAMDTEQDLLDSLSMSFSEVSYSKILESRYGVETAELKSDTLKVLGLSSFEDLVNIKRRSHLNRFKRLLSHNKEIILSKASIERQALIQYFSSMGITKNSNAFSVVDIGHNGSLQKYLSKLMGDRKDIGGYYFMTYHGATELYDQGFDVKGYLADFEDSKCSSHPYCKNIGMFEFLFLPAINSFKRFNLKSGRLVEEYVGGDETARFSVIKDVHKGIIDYVETLMKVIGGDISSYNVSKNSSINTYIKFIENPHAKDAEMFDSLSFVDQFGGSDARFLIASPKYSLVDFNNFSDYLKDSWWREGANAVINGRNDTDITSTISVKSSKNLDEKKMSIFKRKIRKLRANPKGFVVDSKLMKLFK
ncbi:MAG: HAD superfamily hydrolase (TIGR01549 family) [Oceanicoccus sp.]|jgi:HAD superfamily hydrolase (TIGR01549 family)